MIIHLSARQVKYLPLLVYDPTKEESEFIVQRQAFRLFGKTNVLRWRRKGAIKEYRKSEGANIMFKLADLREAAEQIQDYDM